MDSASRDKQAGSVLFIIFVAVALFAALSYAVFGSSRGGSAFVDAERARLYATEITAIGDSYRSAIQKMRISNGCRITTLNLHSPIHQRVDGTALNSVNSSSPIGDSCNLFSSSGGAQRATLPALDAFMTDRVLSAVNLKPGHAAFRAMHIAGVGSDGTNSTNSDLVLIYAWLKPDVCIAFNELHGIANPSGKPPEVTQTSTGGSGTYINGSMETGVGLSHETIHGKSRFCIKNLSGADLYQVIMIMVSQ